MLESTVVSDAVGLSLVKSYARSLTAHSFLGTVQFITAIVEVYFILITCRLVSNFTKLTAVVRYGLLHQNECERLTTPDIQ